MFLWFAEGGGAVKDRPLYGVVLKGAKGAVVDMWTKSDEKQR